MASELIARMADAIAGTKVDPRKRAGEAEAVAVLQIVVERLRTRSEAFRASGLLVCANVYEDVADELAEHVPLGYRLKAVAVKPDAQECLKCGFPMPAGKGYAGFTSCPRCGQPAGQEPSAPAKSGKELFEQFRADNPERSAAVAGWKPWEQQSREVQDEWNSKALAQPSAPCGLHPECPVVQCYGCTDTPTAGVVRSPSAQPSAPADTAKKCACGSPATHGDFCWEHSPERAAEITGRVKGLDFCDCPPGQCTCGASKPSVQPSLTFDRFQAANAKRCPEGFDHSVDNWSMLEWAGAAAGEMGEVANVCKKLKRKEQGVGGKWAAKDPDEATLRANLAEEIGDVLAYLALLAEAAGLNLGMCAAEKFDRVSDKIEWNGERLLASPKKGE